MANSPESDDGEGNGEYTLRSSHTRSRSVVDEGEQREFEAGDTIVPTDAELDAFGDKFQPVAQNTADPEPTAPSGEADASGSSDDADAETAEDTAAAPEPDSGDAGATDEAGSDDTEDVDPAGEGPVAEPSETPSLDDLTADDLDDMSYPELRTLAAESPNVRGDQKAEEIREALKREIDNGGD